MPQADVRQSAVAAATSKLSLPQGVSIRAWIEEDFSEIQRLSRGEGWPTPEERPAEALHAWQQSWPVLVATKDERVIGFVRALTDEEVTMYIAELLVDARWRGRGVGRSLLEACHNLHPHTRQDLLSTEGSDAFYQAFAFRGFAGFRKNWPE